MQNNMRTSNPYFIMSQGLAIQHMIDQLVSDTEEHLWVGE